MSAGGAGASATRVLLVEDEAGLRRALRLGLAAKGYEVLEAADGEEALALAQAEHLDLVVLDLGLPRLPGFEVLRRLRRFSAVPVVVLSARYGQADKVRALDLGADDYVTKPFDAPELLARLRAALRRAPPEPASAARVVAGGGLEIDLARRQVRRDGDPVRLTRTELALLEELVAHPGKLLTYDHLALLLPGEGRASADNSALRAHVKELRRKLGDDAANPRYVLTETGIGYRWVGAEAP